MASLLERFLTPEQYLAIELQAAYKSEYLDGAMVAMDGGSERHNLIVANLIISIGVQLKGRPCRVYPSDLKVRVPNSTKLFYPDVSVVCGETQFASDHKDVILNPTLIVEVSSESTAPFDKGKKFCLISRLIRCKSAFSYGRMKCSWRNTQGKATIAGCIRKSAARMVSSVYRQSIARVLCVIFMTKHFSLSFDLE
jgi:hypothetical protein